MAIRQAVVGVACMVVAEAAAVVAAHGTALTVTRLLELATSMVVVRSASMVVEQATSMVVTVVTADVAVAEELEDTLCVFAVARMVTLQLGAQMPPPKLQALKRMTRMWERV